MRNFPLASNISIPAFCYPRGKLDFFGRMSNFQPYLMASPSPVVTATFARAFNRNCELSANEIEQSIRFDPLFDPLGGRGISNC